MRRRRLRIALRGLGPGSAEWVAAVSELADRVAIAAVSDRVEARRDVAARRLGAFPASGLRALTALPRLDGVIVCEPGPAGLLAATTCARSAPAVMLTVPPFDRTDDDRIGGDVMAALRRRFAPTSRRVRELTATTLGPPTGIVTRIDAEDAETVAEAVDFARFLGAEPDDGKAWRRVDNELRWGPPRIASETSVGADVRAVIACERGVVTVRDDRRLCVSGRDVDDRDENLETDRDAVSAAIDLFARRAAGGLVPVPTVRDVAIATRIARRLRTD